MRSSSIITSLHLTNKFVHLPTRNSEGQICYFVVFFLIVSNHAWETSKNVVLFVSWPVGAYTPAGDNIYLLHCLS